MKKILFFILLSFATAGFGQTKQEKIKHLLQLTRSGETGVQAAMAMLENFRTSSPGVPELFFSEFANEMKPELLVQRIIPIYDRHFTEKEIDGLIAFYNTELGTKLISKQPVILSESNQIGLAWSQEIFATIIKKLDEKGLFQQPPPPAVHK